MFTLLNVLFLRCQQESRWQGSFLSGSFCLQGKSWQRWAVRAIWLVGSRRCILGSSLITCAVICRQLLSELLSANTTCAFTAFQTPIWCPVSVVGGWSSQNSEATEAAITLPVSQAFGLPPLPPFVSFPFPVIVQVCGSCRF